MNCVKATLYVKAWQCSPRPKKIIMQSTSGAAVWPGPTYTTAPTTTADFTPIAGSYS